MGDAAAARGYPDPPRHGAPPLDAAALIAAYLDAFNRGDRAAMLGLLADDVAHDVNQGAREVGRDAFAAFMARMDRCYRERLVDIVILADATGTRAAAEFVVEGEYLATDEGLPPARGQAYRLPAGAFYTIRDGRIARVAMHYNLAKWIAQVSAAS